MQGRPQRPQLCSAGDPLQHLEDPSAPKASRRPWSNCSARLVQDMVGKAQPRVEWRQPDQSDMNTNKRTLVNIVCTVIDFDIVDLLFIVLITLSVPERMPRRQESHRKHPIVWACATFTGRAGFAGINSPIGSVISCLMSLSLLL